MAYLVLVVTLLVWSFSFMAAARMRVDLDVGQALAARFLPVLLGSAAALAWRWPPRVPRQAWPRIVALGLLGVPAYNVFFFAGMKSVPSGTAALIVALSPVFTAVLARFVLNEPFGRRRALGLLLALVGVFVVVRFGTDKPADWPYISGALLLVLAPLSWAVYTVIGRRMPREADPFDATFVLLFVGSLPILPLARPGLAAKLWAHPDALLAALYLALGCTLFGFAAWLWALRRLPAGEVAAFVFLNPPLANLWAWLFEGAVLRPPFLLGAGILLAGLAAIVWPLSVIKPKGVAS